MKHIRFLLTIICLLFATQAQAIKVKAKAHFSPMVISTSIANIIIMADQGNVVKAADFFTIGIGGLPLDPTVPRPPIETQ